VAEQPWAIAISSHEPGFLCTTPSTPASCASLLRLPTLRPLAGWSPRARTFRCTPLWLVGFACGRSDRLHARPLCSGGRCRERHAHHGGQSPCLLSPRSRWRAHVGRVGVYAHARACCVCVCVCVCVRGARSRTKAPTCR
jgi:hypothetical protein